MTKRSDHVHNLHEAAPDIGAGQDEIELLIERAKLLDEAMLWLAQFRQTKAEMQLKDAARFAARDNSRYAAEFLNNKQVEDMAARVFLRRVRAAFGDQPDSRAEGAA